MTTDFRALCAELLDWAEVTAAHYIQLPAVMLRARAALADEPAVPDGREPASVVEQPKPVPVSERLPRPEEMTEDSEVWIEDPGHNYPLADSGDYDWDPHKWVLRPIGKFDAKNGLRWLPAHALPLPGQEAE